MVYNTWWGLNLQTLHGDAGKAESVETWKMHGNSSQVDNNMD